MTENDSTLRYRSGLDILYYNDGERSMSSIDIGNITLDLGRDGGIVGLEIHKAGETLAELTGGTLTREMLSSIEDISIRVNHQHDAAMVVILLYYREGDKQEQESVSLSMSREAVPATA